MYTYVLHTYNIVYTFKNKYLINYQGMSISNSSIKIVMHS